MGLSHDAFVFRLENTRRLLTKEDSFHFHKTLGLICLLHYIYRFTEWYGYRGIYLGDTPELVLATIALHMALSASSFIFRIPQNRVKAAPMIWPEFRAHSVLFAWRSLLTMAIMVSVQGPIAEVARIAIAMGTLIAADVASNHYKRLDNKLGTTMRGMPPPAGVSQTFMAWLNFYYSFSQVLATLTILYVPDLGSVFWLLLPIQLAAFLMTLVRKSIITAAGWHWWYAVSLLVNYMYGVTCSGVCRMHPLEHAGFWASAFVFSAARFGFRANKYALWAVIIAARIVLRQQLQDGDLTAVLRG